ncbi:kinase-like domain-containing protein [Xylaria telfairii]|nr:kinase-like domain-containing protein [Xylaria telfairii]
MARYVIKRIIPSPSNLTSDRVQLAAITNEVRILANETLKMAPGIVKLLGVAWDEFPTAEFIADHDDATKWDVKVGLLHDLLRGLQVLHDHKVVHGDLKLENVLVFQREDPESMLETQYQAKLCDFGFSVITSDYPAFTARLGTNPWAAPELTFRTAVKIEDLYAADTYSFGLLLAHVFMHGGNLFDPLEDEDILRLKKSAEVLNLAKTISSAIFRQVDYTPGQKAMIEKQLQTTLITNPGHRFPLNWLAIELKVYGLIKVFEEGKEPKLKPSRIAHYSSTIARYLVAPGCAMVAFFMFTKKFNSPFGRLFLPAIFVSVLSAVYYKVASHYYQPETSDPWVEGLVKPQVIEVKPIRRLKGFSRSLVNLSQPMDFWFDMPSLIPDFEGFGPFPFDRMPRPTAREVIQDLKDLASKPSHERKTESIEATLCEFAPDWLKEVEQNLRGEHLSHQRQSGGADAAFQLAVIHFEGNCVAKDYDQCFQWLESAVIGGCAEAISGCAHLYAASGRVMSPQLAELVQSRLPQVAQMELIMSTDHIVMNQLSPRDRFLALRQWVDWDSSVYDVYLMSPQYKLSILVGIAIGI